jgi:methylase of polypeptide subunit release factors
LLLLGDALPAATVAGVLPLDVCGGLLDRAGDEVRAPLEVAPYGDDEMDWYVVSDRTDRRGRPQRVDHVLGVGGASTTLAQLTVRRPVRRALDVGTGCGVQALHLSRHAASVVATDAVPRALDLAAVTFALSGVEAELVEGDLIDPVAGREFDLVVCNPPFVVGPRARFTYRDGGRAGDAMSLSAIEGAASVLAPDGVAQLLVNWLHRRDEPWQDRVAEWVSGLGCDAWLIERDVQDPVDYVSTWLSDAGEAGDDELAAEWLRWLRDQQVEGIGFGWVVLRRTDGSPRIAVEAAPQPVDQPLGAAVGDWLDRVEWLRERPDDEVLSVAYTPSPDLRHDVVTGAAGEVLGQALRLDSGFRWSLPCDDAVGALVAGCDGSTPLRAVAAVLAVVLDTPDDVVLPAVASTVRGLVDRGLLLPPNLAH